MCLWLLTACLGLVPTSQYQIAPVAVGNPASIIVPTTTTTTTSTTTTTARPTGNPNVVQVMNPAPNGTMPSNMSSGMTSIGNNPFPSSSSNPGVSQPNGVNVNPNAVIGNPGAGPTNAAMTNPNMGMFPGGTNPGTGNIPSPFPGGINPVPPSVFPIDPRRYTTPPVPWSDFDRQGAYDAVVITPYNAPSSGTVNFPRDRRSTNPSHERIVWKNIDRITNRAEYRTRRRRQTTSSCMCIAGTQCPNPYGAGVIDFRIVTPTASSQCPPGSVYCCGIGTGITTVGCGQRQTLPTQLIGAQGQADYGEFPWQALILTISPANDYVAGGVLVDERHVLTVVHRLTAYVVGGRAPNLKVRLGEWDAAGTYEPHPYQEYTVLRAFVHPAFVAATLQNEPAVLRFAGPALFTPQPGAVPTVNRACLPTSAGANFDGQRCWVTGWGKNAFGAGGTYQEILKKVDVSVMPAARCQAALRNTKLGPAFVLDTNSFVCAGGEPNKDACTGDGGSALVCGGGAGGSFVVAGLVSWGVGCAAAGVPAAYVNVPAFLPWIQQQVVAA